MTMAGPQKKRVLFLSYNFPPKMGGQEQVIAEVWKKFCDQTESVALVQFGAYSDIPTGRVLPAPRKGLLFFFRHLLRQGNRLLETEPFDLVVAANGLVAWPAQHLAHRHGCESAAILYGLDTIHSSPLYQALLRRALPRLDRIVAISRSTAQEALNRGARNEGLTIIPPGCHATPFLQPRDPLSLKEQWNLGQSPVILSPGRLVPRKGIDRFIRECFPRILEKVPNAKLLLAGGNPEEALFHKNDLFDQVMQTLAERDLKHAVRLTGRLSGPEMVEAFALADVVILPVVPLPNDMEGFGIILLEAAAAGKPTVATRIGGIPDAVIDGKTGFLAPPLDDETLANRIITLLDNPEKAREMGACGRQRVLDEFRWDPIATRYTRFLLGEEKDIPRKKS